jgi:hypothetical protein
VLFKQDGSTHTPPLHEFTTQSPFVEQPWFTAHFVAQGPPQSLSVSVPFFRASLQVGAVQVSFEQTPLLQSVMSRHFFVSSQRFGQPAPQSTSPSVPLRMPSEQLGSAQRPSLQFWLSQPRFSVHTWPALQRLQTPAGSPQSLSTSPWFLMPSEQDAEVHVPPLQTVLSQSLFASHFLPPSQGPQEPPQS